MADLLLDHPAPHLRGVGRWAVFVGIILGMRVMSFPAPVVGQDRPDTAVPAVLAALDGAWRGTGELLGRPGDFRMQWETRPQGFVRLVFSNAWVAESGESTPVLAAEATYFVRGSSALGVWVDSRPQQLTLRAVLTDSTVVTDWTAEAERGRTEYIVRSADEVIVRDYVLVDGEYQRFADAAYRRDPPALRR